MKGRDTIEIEHPPGEEIQWDWFERRRAPWGGTAYVLLGTLPHSSRIRGVLAESLDQAHLIEAMDAVMRRLGGTARVLAHRPAGDGDRARHAATCSQLRAGGEALRRDRGAVPAAAREPQGRGRSRGALHVRTVVADDDRDHPGGGAGVAGPRSCAGPGDARERRTATGVRTTVGALGDAEPLLALPAARSRRRSRSPGGRARTRRSRSAGTATRSRPASPMRACSCATAWARRPSRSTRPPVRCWPRTGSRRPARGASCAAPSSAPRSSGSCCPRSPPTGPATARPTGRPAPDALAEAARLLGNEGRAVVVDLAAYAALVEGASMSENSTYQQLRGHLAYLRLAAAAEALPGELDHAAKAKLGHTAFLERLLDVEVAATEARRHASLARFACLPAPWRLADFDFDAQPSVDRTLVNELGTLRFLDDATNVLFIGPPGVGKTMLAVGLGHAAVDAGYRTYYTTAADLAARCHRAALEGRWATTMRFFAGPRLLIIDEVGYLPLAVRSRRRAVPGHHPALPQGLDRADHQPRHRVLGPDLRRPHRRRRHARPAPAPLRRVQHRRRQLPHARPPRPRREPPQGGHHDPHRRSLNPTPPRRSAGELR